MYSNLLDHQDEMASIVLDVEEQLVLDCIFLFTPTLLTVKFGQLIDKLMEEFNKLMTKSQFYHDELEFRAVIEDIYQEMKFLLK